MIAFTCDIDWAPEQVIADTLQIFEEHQIPCTVFATHKSDVIQNCSRSLFEIGIHPNFNPILQGQGGNADEVLASILRCYPESKGVRSHSMMTSTPLIEKFLQHGLKYDANLFLPYAENVKPYKSWLGLVRIPYIWEDDIHFMYGRSFDSSGIDLQQKGVKVFDFHPVHVFLNTENPGRYTAARPHYQDSKGLQAHQNRGPVAGTRDLLVQLLKSVRSQRLKTFKLIEIAEEYSK